MSGIQIVGQNQTTTNIALKIANSNNINYNDDENENHVCKAMFWGFFALVCVGVCTYPDNMCQNKMRKGKQQVRYLLSSISA